MSRLGPSMRAVIAIVLGSLLVGGGLLPVASAATPDRSEVVLVLDFSASILRDKANRDRFATALERIADRVDETAADLVAGDVTMTIIQFASRAADYAGCADLRLLDSPETVARFADCLRSVAGAYRGGMDPALRKKIGIDTNYVAALEQAAKHLPADAVRPAVILFTDGKHDVDGVPASRVPTTLDRLFGNRSPVAILPVGMGLASGDRAALEAGLARMRIIKDMPACVSGATFDWPQVVFETADEAGSAVAVALQDATCTFTVAIPPTPAPTATPTPTPQPAIAAVQGIRVAPRDGKIELVWPAAAAGGPQIIDYRVRCHPAAGGDFIESTEGVSLERKAVVEGLTNGTEYQCEVAAVGPDSLGPWTSAGVAVTPTGRPPAPGKPVVSAQNQAVQISVTPADAAGLSGFHYECSSDNGATWASALDVASAQGTTAQIGDLTNGTEYVCRVFAVNDIGPSEASPVSEAVRPCGTTIECTPILAPFLVVLGIVLVGGLAAVVVALARARRRGYVLAVIDVAYTANLGYGSNLGIGFVRDPDTKKVTGVVADPSKKADIRIRHRGGGRFEVRDRRGKQDAEDGMPVIVTDPLSGRHEIVLRAFNTNAASEVATRR